MVVVQLSHLHFGLDEPLEYLGSADPAVEACNSAAGRERKGVSTLRDDSFRVVPEDLSCRDAGGILDDGHA